MKVGVPGEFHEDRWQRTAEDSERLCSRAHGKQAVPIEFKLSRGKGELLTGLWHDDLAHRCLSGILAWRSDTKPMPNRSMNGVNGWLRHGHPCLQMYQWHPSGATVSWCIG